MICVTILATLLVSQFATLSVFEMMMCDVITRSFTLDGTHMQHPQRHSKYTRTHIHHYFYF